jgi:hypothetical protein
MGRLPTYDPLFEDGPRITVAEHKHVPHPRQARRQGLAAMRKPTKPSNGPTARATQLQLHARNACTRARRWGQRLTEQEHAETQAIFLEYFRKTGNVSAACHATGISRTTLYRWRAQDGVFLAAYRDAEEEAADMLDLAARQRAVDGVDHVVTSAGNVVYIADPDDPTGERQIPLVEKRYSDMLLIKLLQLHHPKYRNWQGHEYNQVQLYPPSTLPMMTSTPARNTTRTIRQQPRSPP